MLYRVLTATVHFLCKTRLTRTYVSSCCVNERVWWINNVCLLILINILQSTQSHTIYGSVCLSYSSRVSITCCCCCVHKILRNERYDMARYTIRMHQQVDTVFRLRPLYARDMCLVCGAMHVHSIYMCTVLYCAPFMLHRIYGICPLPTHVIYNVAESILFVEQCRGREDPRLI